MVLAVILAVAFAGSKKEKIEVTKEIGLLQQVKEKTDQPQSLSSYPKWINNKGDQASK